MTTPAEFASRARAILSDPGLSREARHRAFDALSNETLRSLGFGEGVELFVASVAGCHDEPRSP